MLDELRKAEQEQAEKWRTPVAAMKVAKRLVDALSDDQLRMIEQLFRHARRSNIGVGGRGVTLEYDYPYMTEKEERALVVGLALFAAAKELGAQVERRWEWSW